MAVQSRIALMIACVTAAIMLVRAFGGAPQFDAAYILSAGRAWAAGADPYSPALAAFAKAYMPASSAVWAYPPQWWAIATGLAQFPDHTALLLWKIGNISALLIGATILYRSFPSSPWIAALFAAALFTSDVTKIALQLGQTSLIILLGFALLLRGVIRDSRALQTSGLVLLLLKPQLGLVYATVALANPQTRKAAILALAVTAAMCLPILFEFGFKGTVDSASGLLRNLSTYPTMKWNRPLEVSGLPLALMQIGLPAIPSLLCVAAAAGLSLLCAKFDPDPLIFWLMPLAITYAIVPLHPYDFVLAPVFVLLLTRLSLFGAACTLAAIGMCWRSTSLPYRFFMDTSAPFDSVWVMTTVQAGILTFAGLLLLFAITTRASTPYARAPEPVKL